MRARNRSSTPVRSRLALLLYLGKRSVDDELACPPSIRPSELAEAGGSHDHGGESLNFSRRRNPILASWNGAFRNHHSAWRVREREAEFLLRPPILDLTVEIAAYL